MSLRSIAACLALMFLLPAVLPALAAAGPHPDAKLIMHLVPVPERRMHACLHHGVETFDQVVTAGDVGTLYYAYILVADIDTTIPWVLRPVLPFFEVPFSVFNTVLPQAARRPHKVVDPRRKHVFGRPRRAREMRQGRTVTRMTPLGGPGLGPLRALLREAERVHEGLLEGRVPFLPRAADRQPGLAVVENYGRRHRTQGTFQRLDGVRLGGVAAFSVDGIGEEEAAVIVLETKERDDEARYSAIKLFLQGARRARALRNDSPSLSTSSPVGAMPREASSSSASCAVRRPRWPRPRRC